MASMPCMSSVFLLFPLIALPPPMLLNLVFIMPRIAFSFPCIPFTTRRCSLLPCAILLHLCSIYSLVSVSSVICSQTHPPCVHYLRKPLFKNFFLVSFALLVLTFMYLCLLNPFFTHNISFLLLFFPCGFSVRIILSPSARLRSPVLVCFSGGLRTWKERVGSFIAFLLVLISLFGYLAFLGNLHLQNPMPLALLYERLRI